MTKILHFRSPDTVEILKGRIEEGVLIAQGKPVAWELKDIPSLKLIKGTIFGEVTEPLYITTWDSVKPAKIDHKIEELKKIKKTIEGKEIKENAKVHKVELKTTVEKYNTPESFYKTMTLRILGNILKYKRPISPILLIIMGLVLGFVITYTMFAMKLIVIPG